MTTDFTIQQIADAAEVTRYQVEAWISRGHFKPENPVENGKARKFTYDDAVVLGALAAFNRLGLAPTVVAMHTAQLRFRAGRGSLFVIASERRTVTGAEIDPGNGGEIDLTSGHIVDHGEVIRLVTAPQVDAIAAVDIDQIEHRVRASLGVA